MFPNREGNDDTCPTNLKSPNSTAIEDIQKMAKHVLIKRYYNHFCSRIHVNITCHRNSSIAGSALSADSILSLSIKKQSATESVTMSQM